MDLTIIKLIGYGGLITWLSITGGGTWHGVSIRPCTAMLCSRPPLPPLGSYWTYQHGRYLAAYNGRIWPGQRQLAGFWH